MKPKNVMSAMINARTAAWDIKFHAPTTYPGQGTNREGRPGLGSMHTYAPRPCPVDAYGCSAVASAAILNVISLS